MTDGVHLLLVEKQVLENKVKALEAKLRLVEDNMDEILILSSPESMREVALFVKQVAA